ncbi:hypothetical protein [Nostoc sp. TCL26-01]|uniref:hypothetical protein n=1 Tax=Nostoc sp. TCL26-01 TaxID=2576904 RepID=UPI0015BCCB87|nr:hypothetical protein [Nostoc sp. TCL26-01]
MELTLQQLFGVNSSQNSQTLTINKSDLNLLTPSSNNTAESLLTAILLKSLENFQGYIEDENNIPITDENDTPISFDNKNAYTFLRIFNWQEFFAKRNNQQFIRKTIVIDTYEAE